MSSQAVISAHAIPGPGAVIEGKYAVERVVGSGGMGVVLAARHLQLKHPVAIKVLVPGDEVSPEATARLLREAQLTAGLTSDHVVRVFDVGVLEDGSPFLVMELLVGEDLRNILRQRRKLPLDEALELMHQTCDAIADAHAAGIVHRDLKPSNVFVTRRRDGRVVAKVLDFGISKALDPAVLGTASLTGTHALVGSPLYMAPEQIRDPSQVDPRADIWALGMLLYEMLAGEPAFRGHTLPGIALAIAEETPEPVSSRRPDVPTLVDGILQRCLEKDPAARYQSVSELAADLELARQRTSGLHAAATAPLADPELTQPSLNEEGLAARCPSDSSSQRKRRSRTDAPPLALAAEPMRFEESPFRAKGSTVVGLYEYADRCVPGGQAAVIAALPLALRDWAQQVFLPIAWYDALRLVDLSEAMATVQGIDLHESVRSRARFIATRDLTGLYRLLLKVVSPEFVVERLQRAALRYFDFGKVVVLETGEGGSLARFDGLPLRLYPWFVPMLEGYSAVLLESAGARASRIAVKAVTPSGQERGFPLASVEVELNWD